jgi:hypothetical protein
VGPQVLADLSVGRRLRQVHALGMVTRPRSPTVACML